MLGRLIPALIGALLARPALAQVLFVDVSGTRGIGSFQSEDGRGVGVAAEDYDSDGDVDFFAPQAEGLADLLYRNLGNGVFEEVAEQVGLGSLASGRTALWLDYDGDSRLDLLVANDDLDSPSTLTLYRQDASGQFEDVTQSAGLVTLPNCYIPGCPNFHWAGICAGDINNDGYLDIYTAQYSPGPAHLFLNTGTGGFVDIGPSSGVGVHDPKNPHFLHQPVMADFNNDGWLDIYVAVDVGASGGDPNHLWINQQDNTFLDLAAQAGLDNAMDDMGIALGDYDNDGDLDIYVTNVFHGGEHNVLFRNDSDGQVDFTEVSVAMGVDQGGWGWGTTFFDADLDGDLDLAATNGWRSGKWTADPSRFFINEQAGAVAFLDQSDDAQFNDTDWGSALVAADFDRDGDQDLLQACVTFYQSGNPTQFGPLRLLDNVPDGPGPANHYLAIQPRQPRPNDRAIGAIVRVTAGGQNMMRLITAGTSFLGQEPAEAFFGLGASTQAAEVTVEWPDGATTTLQNVPADQVLTIRRCADFSDCADIDGDGLRDDPCQWYACAGGVCASEHRDAGQADMAGFAGECPIDGACDINDKFAAQNCFADENTLGQPGYPCEANPPSALHIDAVGFAGSCALDGVCDINDAFASENCFANEDTSGTPPFPCSCDGPSPAPSAPQGRIPHTGAATVLLRGPRAARPGDVVAVDVLLEGALSALRGYQLHLGTSGGARGALELVDVVVDSTRGDYALAAAPAPAWSAFNVQTQQMFAAVSPTAVTLSGRAYLATFTYRVPQDASGTFLIGVRYDARSAVPQERTFVFASPAEPVALQVGPELALEVLPPRMRAARQ